MDSLHLFVLSLEELVEHLHFGVGDSEHLFSFLHFLGQILDFLAFLIEELVELVVVLSDELVFLGETGHFEFELLVFVEDTCVLLIVLELFDFLVEQVVLHFELVKVEVLLLDRVLLDLDALLQLPDLVEHVTRFFRLLDIPSMLYIRFVDHLARRVSQLLRLLYHAFLLRQSRDVRALLSH